MRLRLLAVSAAACVLAAAGSAHAGRQQVFRDALELRGFTFQSIQFSVPGDWMRDPRLRGRLEVSGRGRQDLDLLVLHDGDVMAWEGNRIFAPIHSVSRGRAFDLDVPLPGPGTYALVLSNRFSKLAGKRVQGEVLLTWAEDPALPAGEALRAGVRFTDLPAGAGERIVPLRDDDPAVRARLAHASPDSPWTIAVARPAGDVATEIEIGTYPGAIEAVGAADVHGDGDRDLFLVGTSRDTAGAWRDLVLVCPRQRAMLGLSLGRALEAGGPPRLRFGPGYAQARFAAEQSFLERVRSAYAAP